MDADTALRAQRTRSQLLAGQPASPIEVVVTMGAIQAQNRAAALSAIGVRSPGSTIDDLEAAFDSGAIVRSWTMRGTLHIVPAEDLGWMLSLTADRTRTAIARESRQLGISESEYDRGADVIAQHVAEHGPATRSDAVATLDRAGVGGGGESAYRYIRGAALRRLVAWGPMRGRQPLLVAAPVGPELERDEALARFITTYLRGHGPATVRDFAWWSGLTLTDARTARAAAGAALQTFGSDDDAMLITADAPPAAAAETPSGGQRIGVRVVPAWDEYVLGYRDRGHVLPDRFAPRVSPSGNGVFLPAILSEGRVVGTWTQSIDKTGLHAAADPFERLTAAERRGFEKAVAELARFLGVPMA